MISFRKRRNLTLTLKPNPNWRFDKLQKEAEALRKIAEEAALEANLAQEARMVAKRKAKAGWLKTNASILVENRAIAKWEEAKVAAQKLAHARAKAEEAAIAAAEAAEEAYRLEEEERASRLKAEAEKDSILREKGSAQWGNTTKKLLLAAEISLAAREAESRQIRLADEARLKAEAASAAAKKAEEEKVHPEKNEGAQILILTLTLTLRPIERGLKVPRVGSPRVPGSRLVQRYTWLQNVRWRHNWKKTHQKLNG